MNNLTLGEFCFTMIGRADIEGSKSNVAMNAWLPQASYYTLGYPIYILGSLWVHKVQNNLTKYSVIIVYITYILVQILIVTFLVGTRQVEPLGAWGSLSPRWNEGRPVVSSLFFVLRYLLNFTRNDVITLKIEGHFLRPICHDVMNIFKRGFH